MADRSYIVAADENDVPWDKFRYGAAQLRFCNPDEVIPEPAEGEEPAEPTFFLVHREAVDGELWTVVAIDGGDLEPVAYRGWWDDLETRERVFQA